MVHKFFIMLMCVFGLSACSTAYGEEVLNLELLCEGTATPQFNDSEMAERYKFRQMVPTTMVDNKFEERLSIKDNKFEFYELAVTETKIEVKADTEVMEMAASMGVKLSGSLDRLTGALKAEVLFTSEELLSKFSESNSEILGMVGVVVTGQCTKLAPKKKLF